MSSSRNRLIIAGSAFYWAWCAIYMSALVPAPLYISHLTAHLQMYVVAPTIVIVALLHRRIRNQKTIDFIAVLALGFASISSSLTLLAYFGAITPNITLSVIQIVCDTVATGLLMQVWSLHFSLLEPREAMRVVSGSTLFALTAFLLVVGTPEAVRVAIVCSLLIASSICTFAIREDGFADSIDPSRVSGNAIRPEQVGSDAELRRRWHTFWLTRLLYGFAIGFVRGMVDLQDPILADSPVGRYLSFACGGLMLILAISFLCFPQKLPFRSYYLSMLPIFAATFFIVPILGSDMRAIEQVAPTAAWLAFMIMSSSQISYYREQFKIRSTTIAFFEKVVVMGTWAVTFFIGSAAGALISGGNASSMAVTIIASIFAYVTVIAVTFSLVRYAMVTLAPAPVADVEADRKATDYMEAISEACASLAKRFDLTPRETEILAYLASGRSKPYIQEALCISDGTAKTHIAHIYQKLGIHKNQELIDMVEAARPQQR